MRPRGARPRAAPRVRGRWPGRGGGPRRLEVVDGGRRLAAAQAVGRVGELLRRSAAGRARRTRDRRRRCESGASSGHDDERVAAGRRQRLHVLAGAGDQCAGPGAAARARRRRGASAARRGSARPESAAASRRAAAASAEPPPMPAATGTLLDDGQACEARRPSRWPRGTRRALGRRGSRRRRPGRRRHRRPAAPPGARRRARRPASDRLERRDERVQAVGPRRADEQAEVDLAGRAGAQHRRSLSVAPLGRRQRSARASAGWPIASSAARVRSRTAGPAPGASASERGERLAAVGEAALDERAQAPGRPPGRGGAGRPAPSRRSAPGGTRCAAPCAARARRRELGEHGRDAVGAACAGRRRSRSPTSFCTIATQVRTLVELERAQDHGRRDAVGQVGDDLGRRRVERGEVELDRVAEVQRGVRVRVERVAQRRLQAAVDLDHVHVPRRARPGTPTARRGRRRPPARRRRAAARRRARSRRGCSSRRGSSGRARGSA